MRRFDRVAFEDGSGLVGIDHDSPDKLTARRESLHETDEAFDHDLAPDDLGEFVDLAGIRAIPRQALLQLVLYLIPSNSSPAKRWRIAQLRLAVIANMIDQDGIGRMSFEDLSKELSCTRAILSWHSLKIIDGLGVDKARNGKCRRSRESYRASAIKSHTERGHRMKAREGPQDGEQALSAI